jgi:hypothetical protein
MHNSLVYDEGELLAYDRRSGRNFLNNFINNNNDLHNISWLISRKKSHQFLNCLLI